jgi:mercuric reductase
MDVKQAVDKLNGLLPLAARQQLLDAELRELHKVILSNFVEQGRPLPITEAAGHLSQHSVEEAFQILAQNDLIVLDVEQQMIMGAYPLSYEVTPHVVEVNGHAINAMCALDALSVAPMFEVETTIKSSCAIGGKPLSLHMQGEQVSSVDMGDDLYVGIRWQTPCGAAAHSLCRDMVFLLGQAAADKWRRRSDIEGSVFDLSTAVAISSAFFRPLLAGSDQ